MASSPDILDELTWLAPAPRRTRKAMLLRHGRTVLILAGLAAPLLIANGHFGWTDDEAAIAPEPVAQPTVIADPFAPKALRPLSPLEAETWNRAVPEAQDAGPAATPFAVGLNNAQSFSRSLQCMTAAIYYEAANEPLDGQRAVAQVVLNRMRSPAYPHSVCGVVYQGSERKTGCQFSFTCDGSLARTPSAAGWARASLVASAALGGYVYAPVGWATHYHADYVVPYWAQSLNKLSTIGRHIFYGWKGASGTGAGFTSAYSGIEPDVAARGAMAAAASQALPGLVETGGIVRVTSAERPMIDFGGDAAKAPAKDRDAEPKVFGGARWVIGASPATSRYGGARLAIPAATASPAPELAAAETKDKAAAE